jgi:inner membrane protein
MTLYTHTFVGLGLGNVFFRRRMPVLFWFLAGLLPVIADFDSFSYQPYGSNIWGHRGVTHSLTFALVVGPVTAAATFHYFKMKFWLLAGFFFLITASHGLLDALTFGGAGIPFFWPFSDKRFLIWGLVRVPDIGFEMPDPWRSQSIRGELLWVWLPMMVLVLLISIWRLLRWRRAAPK